jgi:hypothetical protein
MNALLEEIEGGGSADPTKTPTASKNKKLPTYADAQASLMGYLKDKGWKVVDSKLGYKGKETMKVPHATSPSGDLRLWFKSQAVYFSTKDGGHDMKGASSLHTDIRSIGPEQFLDANKRYWPKGY